MTSTAPPAAASLALGLAGIGTDGGTGAPAALAAAGTAAGGDTERRLGARFLRGGAAVVAAGGAAAALRLPAETKTAHPAYQGNNQRYLEE